MDNKDRQAALFMAADEICDYFNENSDIFVHLADRKDNDVYAGKRVKRGLFKSNNGVLINADLNGALNILRKEIPNAFEQGYGIEVCSTPTVLTVK